MRFYSRRGSIGINREDQLKQKKMKMNILLASLGLVGYTLLLFVLHFASKV